MNETLEQRVQQRTADLKDSYEACYESEQTIRDIVDSSQDWIWAIDLQGHHTYSNPAVEGILGYRPDELVCVLPRSFKIC